MKRSSGLRHLLRVSIARVSGPLLLHPPPHLLPHTAAAAATVLINDLHDPNQALRAQSEALAAAEDAAPVAMSNPEVTVS